MSTRHRARKRRAIFCIDGVCVGAPGEQRLDDGHVAGFGRDVKRRMTAGVRDIHVGAGFNQQQ
jgi:hypothetical protein